MKLWNHKIVFFLTKAEVKKAEAEKKLSSPLQVDYD